jgi:diguanylate cyclase (GGDEF)-like protein
LDIDNFKAYNDEYGHLAGDEVLQRVAGAIQSQCRSGDAAYRYGGEEFLVTLPEQTRASGVSVAERLRHTVEELEIPHSAEAPFEVITISAGVAAVAGHDGKTADKLLNEADDALYKAKAAGKNRVEPLNEGGT